MQRSVCNVRARAIRASAIDYISILSLQYSRSELPPKHEIVLTVRLSEEQRSLYNATLSRAEPSLSRDAQDARWDMVGLFAVRAAGVAERSRWPSNTPNGQP